MRVLVNATLTAKGGGLFVAKSFVAEALRNRQAEDWNFALSAEVDQELRNSGVALPRLSVNVFDKSPAQSRASRRELSELESQVRPDLVFSVFGPSYVRFKSPHLMGLANAWVTHPNEHAYALLNRVDRLKSRLRRIYRTRWARSADAWVTETSFARSQLIRTLNLNPNAIFVVPNGCASAYRDQRAPRKPFPKKGQPISSLVMSAHYPHKNLDLIPHVAKELLRAGISRDFQFVLTLPESSRGFRNILRSASQLGVSHCIKTVGTVPGADGPALYRQADLLFLPTVLETSSAVFPEAMAMGLPIVTTDLPFNRESCGDSALYFKPRDSQSAAQAILSALNDETLWNSLTECGKSILGGIPSQEERFVMICDALSATASHQRSS